MNRLLYKPLHRGLLRASATAMLLLPLTLGGARADEVTDWNEHMVAAMKVAGPNAIVNSRDAAMVATAVFDAVNGIERRYEPIHVAMAAPRGASRRAAAVQAAYAILAKRFPAQAADLGAKRAASLAAIGDGGGGQSVARGVAWGSRSPTRSGPGAAPTDSRGRSLRSSGTTSLASGVRPRRRSRRGCCPSSPR